MPESKVSFDTVRRIGLALPGVEESTAYGRPALKVDGKVLTCVPSNQSVEPESLMVRVSAEDRDAMLDADPAVYYVTEHYLGYDAVLVRLPVVTTEVLRDLLRTACNHVRRNSGSRSTKKKSAR